jgi:hypothetical protein
MAQFACDILASLRDASINAIENSITILATHAFEDIEDVASLSKTGNVIFVGKQLGDYSKIIAHAKLSANGAAAIAHVKSSPGRFSQFVMVIGSGPDQVVEVVQHELSPLMLWTLTTNADERNARSLVSAYHPEWTGVLAEAEKLVLHNAKLTRTMAQIGRTVREVFALKRAMETMIISRLRMIMSIQSRLTNGIFDPQADLRDFEDYLRNSIGRTAEDKIATMNRIAA